MTESEPLQQLERTWVRFRGRKLMYFSGCDYFRLASHPQVLAAAETGLRRYGQNVAASRLTTGNHVLYGRLESALARFFAVPNAVLVSAGYMANLVVAQALAGTFSHLLIDSEAHPSLMDAARFFDCPILQFKHFDPADVSRVVQRCGPGCRLILLTDGFFSRDGSVAPLPEYLRALPKDAWMLVDDAHGAGVLGLSGRGTLEHFGLGRRRVIQTLTLSKAFGVYGGVILGGDDLRKRILERSPLFMGSTPLPLPQANAALTAVALLKKRIFRQRLASNCRRLRKALSGFSFVRGAGPIFTVSPERPRQEAGLRQRLLRAGIYPPFLVYPGSGPRGYFRFVISSEHKPGQLEKLAEAIRGASPLFASASAESRARSGEAEFT